MLSVAWSFINFQVHRRDEEETKDMKFYEEAKNDDERDEWLANP